MLDNKIRDIICKLRDEVASENINAVISLHREKSHLMRIGNNSVSLNTSEELLRLDIHITEDSREGSHTLTGNIDTYEDARNAFDIAFQKIQFAKPKNYKPLDVIIEDNFCQEDQYDKELEDLDSSYKIENYRKIFDAIGNQYNYSGSWSSGMTEVFIVATTNKNSTYHKNTDQLFNLVLKHPEKYWELSVSQTGWKKDDFEVNKSIKELQELLKIYENHKAHKVVPGDYTVVLGSQAIAEVLEMASWTGFSGNLREEKQGWTASNDLGDEILGENVTIIDDPQNYKTFSHKFDTTGKKRSRFFLVDKGKLANIMYDNTTAAKYKKKPTGHNLSSSSITLESGSGNESILKEVASLDKVLYIPALHYLNLPNINKGIFTGSSRFNAMLIEKGKYVSPIYSTRITDSFQNVFQNVLALSSKMISVNISSTYGRRSPVALAVPEYIVCKGVKITDCADSFN